MLLSFRYVSDGGVNEGGLLVDDVSVGGTTISDGSSLAPFKSPTEISPQTVQNWNVKLVGIRAGKVATVLQVEWNGRNHLALDRRDLLAAIPFDKVVAIVATDDSVGAGPAVRAVHPEGQRRHPAGRRLLTSR